MGGNEWRDGRRDGGGANANLMRRLEEEVGNEQGGAEGEEGTEVALSAGSGMPEGSVYLQEWVVVGAKLSQHCHHLLTTDATDKEEINAVS